jgi:hypothetical protein
MDLDPQTYQPREISPAMYDPTLIDKLLNTSDVIIEFEHDLKGEVFNENAKEDEPEYLFIGKRWMNDHGIRETISFIRPFFNKVVLSSNYETNTINQICMRAMSTYIDMLFIHSEDYEVDENDLQPLVIKVSEMMYSALSSAGDGGLRNIILKSVSERRILGMSEEKKRNLSNAFGLFGDR